MNKLIKPQNPSYTGADSQVVAYSWAFETTWFTSPCALIAGLGLC